jgi:uncharacterized protein
MEIPLFPLHAVLCPGIALPLHIFEPRYRLLTERCLADSSPFGIVLIVDGREVGSDSVSIASVGTFAEIRESSRLPDGRYDLLVVGSGRFAIERVDESKEPYLVAEVNPIEDELGDADRASTLADRTMRRFVAYLQLLQPMKSTYASRSRPRAIRQPRERKEPGKVGSMPTPSGRRSWMRPPAGW